MKVKLEVIVQEQTRWDWTGQLKVLDVDGKAIGEIEVYLLNPSDPNRRFQWWDGYVQANSYKVSDVKPVIRYYTWPERDRAFVEVLRLMDWQMIERIDAIN